jgi:hypothetical protein
MEWLGRARAASSMIKTNVSSMIPRLRTGLSQLLVPVLMWEEQPTDLHDDLPLGYTS